MPLVRIFKILKKPAKLKFAIKILENEIEIKRVIFAENCFMVIPLLFKKGKLLLQKRVYDLEMGEKSFELSLEIRDRKFIDVTSAFEIIGMFNDYLINDLKKEYFDYIIGKYKIFLENLKFLRKIEKNANFTENFENLVNDLSVKIAFVRKELILEKDQEMLEEFIVEHNYY